MDLGSATSVVQTLLAALACSQLKELCSIAGYKSQLEELKGTVNFIKAVLEDAEQKQVTSKEQQLLIENLKDVLEEADNLFDEFVTLTERKKLSEGTNKVRLLSIFSKYGLAYQISQRAKKIKAKLDGIASNKQFSFEHNPVPIRKISRESSSYEHEQIIGRDDDLKDVMDVLMEPNVEGLNNNVSFLSIVGIGGMGKTALAQLVYNDPRVMSEFSLRKWICVSDEDQEELNVKDILCKILGQTFYTLDEVQGQLRAELEKHKYLLVLDDVWTENPAQWDKLVGYLMVGQRGSWIVVTTRSEKTARLLKHGRMHKLSGLSQENSWQLFKRNAFGSEESNPPEDLVEIGQEIVERCAKVPLAIRVVGSLLRGQAKRQWQSFQEFGLANINEKDDGIMPILKISYYQLPSPLKCCFGYCALFPKDEEIDKEDLIELWIAQGYITSHGLKSMEEVAEEYVLTLIDRGFFQDVAVNYHRPEEVLSFKMHDLMHDVAWEVVGKEICTVNSIDGNLDEKIRHLRHIRGENSKFLVTNKTQLVRSYLQLGLPQHELVIDKASLDAFLANLKYLRALDLGALNIKILPDSIGDLLHLRYLDLSRNSELEVLPRKITKLYNLLILKLDYCSSLKEMPEDMNKLVKLRILDFPGCCELRQMPRGMGKLTDLHTLSRFMVTEVGSSKELFDRMEDLKALKNLKDFLGIQFSFAKNGVKTEKDSGRKGGYLRNMEHLRTVSFTFGYGMEQYEEALMEELQPHKNLKILCMSKYHGVSLAGWAAKDNLAVSLPNLVELDIENCGQLQHLGSIGNLRNLKRLVLISLANLELLIEQLTQSGAKGGLVLLYPSLQYLYMRNLPKLKGWEGDNDELRCLPLLETLNIEACPSLAASLQCPLLEDLHLEEFNKGLKIITGRAMNTELGDVKGKGEEASIPVLLREIYIGKVEWLKKLSTRVNREKEVEDFGDVLHICSSSLESLTLEDCANLTIGFEVLEDLVNLEDLRIISCPKLSLSLEREEGNDMPWPSLSHSLRSLELCDLPQLVVNLPQWMQCLTALQTLIIISCPKLSLSLEREEGSDMPWPSLSHSLRSLELHNLPQLVNLPQWMQCLTVLQSLKISKCSQLTSLPNWMSKLTSLQELRIWNCSITLEERCRDQDRPHIAHIPTIENTPF